MGAFPKHTIRAKTSTVNSSRSLDIYSKGRYKYAHAYSHADGAHHEHVFTVFGRFLEVKSLRRACKVVLWRSCCGLEGLKRATWTPCWLRVGINKASWSFRSAKHVSESLHAETNLRSDVLENRKFPPKKKTQNQIEKRLFFQCHEGPRRAQDGLKITLQIPKLAPKSHRGIPLASPQAPRGR